MGKVIKMSDAERKRNNSYNEGYDTAFNDEEIDLDRYESDDDYRRGYDAGETDRDEEADDEEGD